MAHNRVMKAIVLALVAVCVCVAQEPLSPAQIFKSFVVTDKDAYFVAPPRLVLDARISAVMYTPEGQYGLIHGFARPKLNVESYLGPLSGNLTPPAKPTPIFKVWDIQSDTLRDLSPSIVKLLSDQMTYGYSESEAEGAPTTDAAVAIAPVAEGQFRTMEDESLLYYGPNQFAWTAQPGVALLTKVEGDGKDPKTWVTKVYKLNIADGGVTVIKSFQGRADVQVEASPTKPIVVMMSRSHNKPIEPSGLKTEINFSVCDLSGRELKSGKASLTGDAFFYDWTVDGANMLGSTRVRTLPKVKATSTLIVLNTATGSINETREKIAAYGEPEQSSPLALSLEDGEVKFGSTAKPIQSLWLRSVSVSKEPPLLVAKDVDYQYWLSPKCDTIAYLSNGRLFACEVARMGLDAFMKAKAAAARVIAVSNAKQVALSVMIYSTDCDDFAPMQSNFEDAIYPYLKNREVLDGFVYTFKGGSFTAVADPANTELGHIVVPGGRVVAYVDSHVRFVPNP